MVVWVISKISTCLVSKFHTANAQKCFGFQPFFPLMSASTGITDQRSFARTGFLLSVQYSQPITGALRMRILFAPNLNFMYPPPELFGTSYPSGRNVINYFVILLSSSLRPTLHRAVAINRRAGNTGGTA